MKQRIRVSNKAQLLAAVECAKECTHATVITFTNNSTVFTIYGVPNALEPDKDHYPIPVEEESTPYVQVTPWEHYGKTRIKLNRSITKLKTRVRKTKAEYFR